MSTLVNMLASIKRLNVIYTGRNWTVLTLSFIKSMAVLVCFDVKF